jgi:hypothetical protein
VYAFVENGRGGVVFAHISKAFADSSRLLAKLTQSGFTWVFLAAVKLSCGDLNDRLTDSVSVLTYAYYLALVGNGYYAYCAYVAAELAKAFFSVGQFDNVAVKVKYLAVEDKL